MRTCYLPTETEQGWRKRKDVDGSGLNGSIQLEQCLKVMDDVFSSMVIPGWISGSKASCGLQISSPKSNGGLPPQPWSQGSSMCIT